MGILEEYQDDARVEKPDGTVVGPYKASFPGRTIFILDKNANVVEGDVVLRTLPNGNDERSVVSEANFYKKGAAGIGAHYQIKYTKGGQTEKKSGDGEAVGYPGAYDSSYEPATREENESVLDKTDESKKIAILQETYDFERQQRTDPTLKSKAITQGGLSRGLKFVLGEVEGLCKELEEDSFIKLSRKTIGGESGKRVVKITAAGRKYLSTLSNDALERARTLIKPSPKVTAGSTGPLVLVSASILDSLEQYRDSVRGNNKLKADHSDHHAELMDFLDRLKDALQELINTIPESSSEKNVKDLPEVKTWKTEFWEGLLGDLKKLSSPESARKIALPTTLIFGCGAIGGLVGGPVGYGIGTYVGKVISGEAKASGLGEKVEKALMESDEKSKS